MGSDWLDALTPGERSAWDEFVENFRRDALVKIAGSDGFVSLVPSDGFDVKFAAELGAAIMLDKPIFAIIQPGAVVAAKLRSVVDQIVEADIDTEAGREKVRAAMQAFVGGPR